MSSRVEATIVGIRLALFFFTFSSLNKMMDKTDNFILSIKHCYFIPVLLYFAIQPLKSEPETLNIATKIRFPK